MGEIHLLSIAIIVWFCSAIALQFQRTLSGTIWVAVLRVWFFQVLSVDDLCNFDNKLNGKPLARTLFQLLIAICLHISLLVEDKSVNVPLDCRPSVG